METSAQGNPSTVELPLSAAQRRAIAAEGSRQVRTLIIVAVCIVAFCLLLGLLLEVLPVMAAASLGIVLIFGGVGWWQGRKGGRESQETQYFRTSGPLAVVGKEVASVGDDDSTTTAYALQLCDRALPLSAGLGADLSKKMPNSLPWATVDYSKHLNVIFEIRDAEGRTVYRHPRLTPRE